MFRVCSWFRFAQSKLVLIAAGVFLALFLQAVPTSLPGSHAARPVSAEVAAAPGEYVVKFSSGDDSTLPIIAGETRDLVFEVMEAGTGAPAPDASLEVEIRHLGSRRRIIGTDLPYLEGSRILSVTTAVSAGRWVLEDFRFPIRGTYGLYVRAYGSGPDEGQPGQAGVAPIGQDEFKVAVREDPQKFLWSGLLLGGLLLFGLVVGWLYGPEFLGWKRGSSAGPNPGAVRGALTLLLLQGLLLSAAGGVSGVVHAHGEPHPAGLGLHETAGGRIRLQTSPADPRMDAPAMVNLEVFGDDGQPLSGALLEVEMVMEEHGQVEKMFKLSLLAPQGQTTFLYHFPEGEEFTAGISVRPAEPEDPTSFEPFEGQVELGIAPVQPTLARRLKDLALLMGTFLLGFVAAALIQRRRFIARYA
ncbi:MAG: hypothetical protein HYY09_01650 [Firmicutes bacterium]|nr:hypothetical protein [Bacillota bacterium]